MLAQERDERPRGVEAEGVVAEVHGVEMREGQAGGEQRGEGGRDLGEEAGGEDVGEDGDLEGGFGA